jgi:hypothetical protein
MRKHRSRSTSSTRSSANRLRHTLMVLAAALTAVLGAAASSTATPAATTPTAVRCEW